MKAIVPRPVTAIAEPALLANALAGISYEQLPGDVVVAAKTLILDTLAVAWAASDASGVEALYNTVLMQGSAEQSTAWARGRKLPATSAALYNATLAAALDYDSLFEPSGVHCDAVVLPAAFAVAESSRLDGRRLIAAYVAGCELMLRLGRATQTTSGWFRTTVYGVFGAAAAAGKLLGLGAREIEAVLGIALGQAAGTQQSHIERKLTKRLQAGFAAQGGVISAQLAQQGITGPSRPFDGQFGLYALYDMGDPSTAFDDLGQTYLLPGTTIKKYPCCACSHAAIEAVLELANRHRIDPDAVTSVEVSITPYASRLVGAPFSASGDCEVTGQFCLQYGVAAALYYQRFSPAELKPSIVLHPALRPLISKVRVRIEESFSGRMVPARVRIALRDGVELVAKVDSLPGSPQSPLSSVQMRDKAKLLFGQGAHAMTAHQSEELIERIENLDLIDDLSRLFPGSKRH